MAKVNLPGIGHREGIIAVQCHSGDKHSTVRLDMALPSAQRRPKAWMHARFVVFLSQAAFCLLLAFVGPPTTFGQDRSRDRNVPRPAELVVNVFIDRIQNRAPQGVTVQVQSGFGSTEQDLKTDSNGQVQCHTLTGTHRLRIYGPDIQEYEASFDIELAEIRHTENVVVRAKPSTATTTVSPSGAGIVAAARLKVPEKAQGEFKKGSKALEQKDWSEARKRFEAAISLYPQYDLAYNGLGSAFLASRDLQQARPAFEKAIALNETFAEAYRNLARISFAERNYQEADTLLTKSLSTDPLNVWALTSAANAELLMHHYDEAIAHARKAHTVPHQNFAGVHIVAALALEATQQPFEALREYQFYLDEDPKGRDAARAEKAIARLGAASPK
jgi:Flp pilus assembly protein TadD